MGVIKTRRNDEPPVCLDTEALRTVTPVEHREQPSPWTSPENVDRWFRLLW